MPIASVAGLRWAWPGTWFIVHMHGFDDFPVQIFNHLVIIFHHLTCSIEMRD